MGKNNGNGNGNGSVATQPTVHLVLQGKGGIGKSVVASWLTEFLTTRGQKVSAIDADPVNRSLGQYKALGAEKLDLMNQDGLIERSRFDRLVDRFATEDTVFVVDSGATAFLPFWTYIVEAEMIRVLREAGRNVYVHVPISGGEMLNDPCSVSRRWPRPRPRRAWCSGSTSTSDQSREKVRHSTRCRSIWIMRRRCWRRLGYRSAARTPLATPSGGCARGR